MRVRSLALFASVLGAGAYRISKLEQKAPSCECSETGTVDGVATGKAGCAKHSGPRFGYICYVENGASCPGAQKSNRLGVWWRPCRDEHQREVARDHLLEAMEGIDMRNLQTTIRLARNRHVDPELISQAEQRVEVVAEMLVVRDELMSAIEGFSVERLQAALERVEELELDEHLSDEVLEDAVARFQYLEERTNAETAMMEAIQGWDVEDLEDKHEEAARKHVDPDKLREATDRIAELRRLMAAAQEALATAIKGHDEHAIQAALDEAHRLHAVSARQAEEASERIDQLSRRYEARDDLQSAIEGGDVETVRATLAIAYDLGVNAETVAAGEARIVELEALMESTREVLRSAILTHDASAVQRAREECFAVYAFRDAPELQREADARLAHLAEEYAARDVLQAAIAGSDVEIVRSALSAARALDVVQPVLKAGEDRITELEANMESAREVLRAAILTHDSLAVQQARDQCQAVFAFRDAPELQAEADARLAHLAEEYAARDRLQAAIAGNDDHIVREALAAARALDVVQPVLAAGENRITELEADMESAREVLRAAILTHDSSAVQQARDQCIAIFALRDAPELQAEADARLAHLAEEYVARDRLQVAIEGDDVQVVREALAAARALDVVQPVLTSGENRITQLEAMENEARGRLRGDVDSHDVPRIQQGLTSCIGHFTRHGHSEATARFICVIPIIEDLRNQLQVAIEGYNVEAYTSILSDAGSLGVMQQVRAGWGSRIAQLEAMENEAKSILRESVDSHRPPQIKQAFDQCVATFTGQGHTEANSRSVCMLPIIEELQNQFTSDDMMNLQRMLRTGRDVGMRQDVLDAGEAAADLLRHKMHESKMTMVHLTEACNDADALREALREVERLNSASQQRRNEAHACIDQLR